MDDWVAEKECGANEATGAAVAMDILEGQGRR